MHRSLQIPEVVALICREVAESWESEYRSRSSKTLATFAALARTCKGFSSTSPALDLLWMYQSSLMPLLKCMPGDVWDEDDDGSIRRPVTPADWERPLAYSHRVRSFRYKDRDHSYSPEFFNVLGLCLPGPHLFPNIEYLEWFVSDPASTSFSPVRLFLGPQLTSIFGSCASAAHLSFLPTLARQCPGLTEVGIILDDEMELGGSSQNSCISLFVRGLGRLETLAMPYLDHAAMDHLAGLSTFTSLRLTHQLDTIPALKLDTAAGRPFTSLKSLNVTGKTVAALTDIILPMAHAPIDDLVAIFPNFTTSSTISQLYTILAATCSDGPLSGLTLRAYNGLGGPHPVAAHDASLVVHDAQLRPLFSFHDLTSIKLSAPAGFDLNDDAIGDIARAWPNIRTLQLVASDHAHVQSNMTLGGLLHFARYCPKLTSLSISLDATVVPTFEPLKTNTKQKERKRVRQARLSELDISQSPIGEPLVVAAFLSSIFPKLRFVSTDYHRNPSDNHIALREGWEAVEAALPVLRAVRAEEKYWTVRAQGDT
ncbi:hypothetical protein K438DRAFT_1686914 [Mycena galopus ATCC 62051]|nr:hypothetical protein K438DRAFT_1686914 [Mycena galopus ATCC 62051]